MSNTGRKHTANIIVFVSAHTANHYVVIPTRCYMYSCDTALFQQSGANLHYLQTGL